MKGITVEKKRMKSLFSLTALLLCLLTGVAQAAVILNGKTTSKVSGHVVRSNNLFVTDEQGGWYEQALEMVQLGDFASAYEIAVPLRITSSSGVFQVRMDSALVLQNQAKPELRFRDMAVNMGLNGEGGQALGVAKPVKFTNPGAAQGEDSIGHYLLKMSGYLPAGDFKTVSGTYSGVLSLTFEPILEN